MIAVMSSSIGRVGGIGGGGGGSGGLEGSCSSTTSSAAPTATVPAAAPSVVSAAAAPIAAPPAPTRRLPGRTASGILGAKPGSLGLNASSSPPMAAALPTQRRGSFQQLKKEGALAAHAGTVGASATFGGALSGCGGHVETDEEDELEAAFAAARAGGPLSSTLPLPVPAPMPSSTSSGSGSAATAAAVCSARPAACLGAMACEDACFPDLRGGDGQSEFSEQQQTPGPEFAASSHCGRSSEPMTHSLPLASSSVRDCSSGQPAAALTTVSTAAAASSSPAPSSASSSPAAAAPPRPVAARALAPGPAPWAAIAAPAASKAALASSLGNTAQSAEADMKPTLLMKLEKATHWERYGTVLVLYTVEEEDRGKTAVLQMLAAEGYDHLEASSMASTLLQFNERQVFPDLVLVDADNAAVALPQLIKQLALLNPTVAVLAIASRGGSTDAVSALQAGASDFMWKPLDLEEMVARVGRHVQRQHCIKLQLEHAIEEARQTVAKLTNSPAALAASKAAACAAAGVALEPSASNSSTAHPPALVCVEETEWEEQVLELSEENQRLASRIQQLELQLELSRRDPRISSARPGMSDAGGGGGDPGSGTEIAVEPYSTNEPHVRGVSSHDGGGVRHSRRVSAATAAQAESNQGGAESCMGEGRNSNHSLHPSMLVQAMMRQQQQPSDT